MSSVILNEVIMSAMALWSVVVRQQQGHS